MRVAILGCGPAGLMAAAAVMEFGNQDELMILSNRRKSPLYGAQYLHAPIPNYTDESDYVSVRYRLMGTADEYRRKVYGPMWDGTVSPEDQSTEHNAWDLRETYDRLWEDFEPMIHEVTIDYAGLKILKSGLSSFGQFDLIINSIPKNKLCIQGCQFRFISIIAAGDAPDRGIELPYRQCPDNTVMCNGREHPSWYRLSNIFGHRTAEWGEGIPVPIPTAAQVVKPLSNNCECWPDILHVGRYGKWQKGVLTHHSYEDVEKHFATRT